VRKRLGDVMWDRDRCPICGLAPIAGIAKKVSHGIYARTVPELRCLCGYSWDYDLFRCPACGNRDRNKFEVLIFSGINIHKCIACGHIVGDGRLFRLSLLFVVLMFIGLFSSLSL
jgi:formate dehydrogenase maturation protein FdhE